MNKNKIFQELEEFIAIESVSADASRFDEIIKAADFLIQKLTKLGFEVKKINKENFPPLIVASHFAEASLGTRKTIGIYGHYDVQPVDPVSEWQTPPFSLTLKEGRFYGRGVADNKGHVIANLAAVEELINENIIFILEGEEEVASGNLENYLIEVKDILNKIDVFYVTDVGMYKKNIPQIFYGLRGIVYYELEVWIGERDLHSGVYGNRVLNPIQVVAELLAKIKDSTAGEIKIPGFYDKVRKPEKKELKLLESIARTDDEQKEEANVFGVVSVDKNCPYLSSKLYPSFDANGIISGYTGIGPKTIIPKSAKVKFSFRLVENQDPDEIDQLIREFIKNNLPKEVKYNLQIFGKDAPFYTDINNEYVEKTAKALKEVFGNKTLFNRTGGSIPVAEMFQRLFKKPVVLTGFTLPGDNIHSPNENFDEEMFWKGIEALKGIYST